VGRTEADDALNLRSALVGCVAFLLLFSLAARLVPELIYRENQFVLFFPLLMLFDWEFGSPHEVVRRVTATPTD
jgi:hypothetical protein